MQQADHSAKDQVRRQWDQAAQGWSDHTHAINAWLQEPTRHMMALARIKAGERVVDLAAGAGDQTIDLARRVGRTGEVLATDLSPVILDMARARVAQAGVTNVSFEVADLESLTLPAESFDAAVCRLGLMFCASPLSALQEVHRILKPGGWFCAMVFSNPAHNPCITTVLRTAQEQAGIPPSDPDSPGTLFSLGRAGLLAQFFKDAGFRMVEHECVNAPFHMESARAYLGFIEAAASPVRAILMRMDEDGQRRAFEQMEKRLDMFATLEGWVGPNELLLVAGQR